MESMPLYLLPFDTSINPVRISQGRNGPWSHFLHRKILRSGVAIETDLTHAIDFALPLGTPVLAAREGRVLSMWHRSTWCYQGLDPNIGNNPPIMSTNLVIVDHQDGTNAIYSHLNGDQVVEIGQEIKAGQQIAFTGESGWIAEVPHLHFQVMIDSTLSLPVSFIGLEVPLDHQKLIRLKLLYDPQNTSNL